MRAGLAAAVLAVAASGCVILPRTLDMPPNDVTTVALLTGTLGPPLNDIARHPWFAVRRAGATLWTTYEVGGGVGRERDPFHDHGSYGKPILHGLWRGAEAERAADCLATYGEAAAEHIEDHYVFYPGPNSNTFGDQMLRRCGLHATLPATSVGKDWRGVAGAGVTSEGDGLQLETAVIGVKIGLREGVEIHVIGLTFGIDLWPPAILLPIGPGRIGFADR
nr:DUF3750 domain-containing protein [Kofleriaceae bacterium]